MLHARGGSRDLSHSHRRPHCWRLTLPAGMVPRARHPASKRHDLCLKGAGCTCGLHPKEVSIRGKPCVVGVLSELLPGHSTHPSNRGALHAACLHTPRKTGSEPQEAGAGLPLTRTGWFTCNCLWSAWQHVEQQSRKWSQLLERHRESCSPHPSSP